MNCRHCNAETTVKNGVNARGQQRYKCKACGRQFIPDIQRHTIPPQAKKVIDKLLLEKASLAGIVRATGLSEWVLKNYINRKR